MDDAFRKLTRPEGADLIVDGRPMGDGPQDFPPRDGRFDDGNAIVGSVGRYEASASRKYCSASSRFPSR